MSKTRVLIVDDSALMRQLLTRIFKEDDSIEVIGAVADPFAAWRAIQKRTPDVITLDLEMPKMDGLTFLDKLMRRQPIPVLMVSSLTENGCESTFRALELGAFDFVTKPKIDIEKGTTALAHELIAKVKAAARAKPRRGSKKVGESIDASIVKPKRRNEALLKSTQAVVAIGASTGGTEALREVLMALPADAPGIVIVQHMPEHFTRKFAERLDNLCKIRVKEANNHDLILAGQALIAPGGLSHLEIRRSGANYMVELVDAPPLNHHRPSVDILFESCARFLGANAIGVLMTGMGEDGAKGLLSMRENGARTIAQDEATSVVFGMPRAAILNGAAESVVALERIAPTILQLLKNHARSA